MDGKQQFGLALAAAIGGLVWGFLRHRTDRRVTAFALIQAAEWFVAYGGASAMISAARHTLEQPAGRNVVEDDDFEVERVTRIRQSVTDREGTGG
jgi:hypothetical protein